jgi:enamine deaminase RidA (YjgF/YER057c/UK114 family)
MDLMILKKKIDGYRAANGSIKNVPPELLLELRQTWEHYTGTPEQFRSELGVKTGTLRNLLVESKKLNHVIASAGAVGLVPENTEENTMSGQGYIQNTANNTDNALELVFDHGTKVIRFPNVDLLVDFLRKSA